MACINLLCSVEQQCAVLCCAVLCVCVAFCLSREIGYIGHFEGKGQGMKEGKKERNISEER